MTHDQVAELGGYQAELAGAVQRKDAAHAREVREEIRKRFGTVEQLHVRADAYASSDRPAAAAQARALAAAMADEEPPQVDNKSMEDQINEAAANSTGPASDAEVSMPPATENTADATPMETAVTRRGSKKEN